MFEKLLANLPYNPTLTKQFNFYAHRMRHEESIRRTGMLFIVLAFLVQFFAVLAPPQSSSAYSSSDMINGGISSKADAVKACQNNVKNYGDVMWNFKITCGDIANSSVTSVRSTDYSNNLFSWSWLPYGQTNPHSGKPTSETPYNLAKVSETIYARRLSSADTIPFSTYQVLKGTANGRTFMIMFGCGNLIFVGTPPQAPVCHYNGNVYYEGAPECTPPNQVFIPASLCPYDSSLPKDSPKCQPCAYDNTILAGSKKCVKPCPYDSSIPKDSPACKPCSGALSTENAVACVVERKSASNVTSGTSDADGTTAQPGDVIAYTLFAENQGKADVSGFIMQENLSDVLDYATVVDLHGGDIDSNNVVSWPADTIKPGATLTHQITVRIKDSIPTNNSPAGDPQHFDYIMTNVYGNAVNIKVPLPPGLSPVVTVSSSTALPNTGPGEGLLLAAAIIIVGGYFLARARLLVDETMIVMQEVNAGSI